jgi:cytochrome P450 family 135
VTAVPLPPGPKLPALLQTLGFILAPVQFIDAMRRRYGDVVTFSTSFDSGFVVVFDPDTVKQVFRAPPDRLRAGEANALLGTILGQRSLLLLDGAEHLRQRKLMLPPFHGPRMRAYERVMREAADRELDGWPVGEPFAVMPSMQALTLDVITRAVFGVQEGERLTELKGRLRAMIMPVSRRLGVLILAFSGRRQRGRFAEFARRKAAADELIYDEISRRREATDLDQREDVFSLLVQARDEDGRSLTDQELRDQLVTLLVAGHETTATGLAWAFDLLAHNPRVLERLRASLGAGEDDYLDAVVKETLRIRPVVPGVGRVVRGGSFDLDGWEIPDGVEINPSIALIHRRADRYPDPQEFRPERYLSDDAPDTYTWIPFGGGTRRCLGAAFATFEMATVIRTVLERCEFRPASRRPARMERRGITIVPRDGARIVVTERRRAAEPVADAAPAPAPA